MVNYKNLAHEEICKKIQNLWWFQYFEKNTQQGEYKVEIFMSWADSVIL